MDQSTDTDTNGTGAQSNAVSVTTTVDSAAQPVEEALLLLADVHAWREAERVGAFPHELRERIHAFFAA